MLGPVEVTVGGRPVDLGGAKQRALLAILVLQVNRPVSTDRLIGELWEQPPATALKSVQVYVSRLRRMLDGTSARILTTPAGYMLSTDVEDIDVQEPGPDLQHLHTAILRQDPALQHPGPNPAPPEPGIGDQTEPGSPGGAPSAPSAPAPPLSPDGLPPGERRLWRRLGLIAVPGVALAAVAGLVLTLARPGATRVELRANSVAVIDAATGALAGDISAGNHPGPIAIASGAAWVANTGDETLQRIDLRTRTVTRTFGLSQTPVSLAAGPGVVWIGNAFDGKLSRVLTSYDQLSAPFFPGQPITGLLAVATSPGDLWVGLADDKLLRLDPANLRAKATIVVPDRVEKIAVADRAVWTLQFFDHSVKRIDPRTGRITSTPLPGRPVAIAAGDGAIWVATSKDDQLWKITPATGAVSGSFPLGITPSAIAVQPGAVWVAAGSDGVLERIDPATGTIVPLNLRHAIGGLAIAGGEVWLTLD